MKYKYIIPVLLLIVLLLTYFISTTKRNNGIADSLFSKALLAHQSKDTECKDKHDVAVYDGTEGDSSIPFIGVRINGVDIKTNRSKVAFSIDCDSLFIADTVTLSQKESESPLDAKFRTKLYKYDFETKKNTVVMNNIDKIDDFYPAYMRVVDEDKILISVKWQSTGADALSRMSKDFIIDIKTNEVKEVVYDSNAYGEAIPLSGDNRSLERYIILDTESNPEVFHLYRLDVDLSKLEVLSKVDLGKYKWKDFFNDFYNISNYEIATDPIKFGREYAKQMYPDMFK